MSTPTLTDTSYLVLGLVAGEGPVTSYDLKRLVGESVGYFWSFPHSQLYAEPARLAAAGLLSEEQEQSGRRRRTYRITAGGREALAAWLRDPDCGMRELRDPGLLKLFFAGLAEPEDVAALARAQVEAHADRLALYQRFEKELAADPDRDPGTASVRMGLYVEQAAVRFWSEIAEELGAPPGGAPTPPRSRPGPPRRWG